MFKMFITRGCNDAYKMKPGLKVIKLEYSLNIKIKCNDWLLVDTRPQAANRPLYFGNELKVYNIEACYCFTCDATL